MFHRKMIAGVISFLLLVPLPPIPQSTVPVEDSRWHNERLQSIDVDGGHPSIAVDPLDQDVYISFYHSTTQRLMLANQVGPGSGNCGEYEEWSCQTIDDLMMVGKYSSIDVFNNGSAKRIGIAYHDEGAEGLKFTQLSVDLDIIQPMGNWLTGWVDSGSAGIGAGKYASLKYSQAGTPRIAYTRFDLSGNGDLYFASYVGTGGNCGSNNAWRCDSIDPGSNVAYVSLDLDPWDHPAIAYYDRTNQRLMLALGNQTGGNCGGGAWRCYPIEDTADDVGRFAALAVSDDPNIPFHIAYYNDTTGQLRYAHSTSGTPNCGGGLPLICYDVEPMDARITSQPVPELAGITIAVDGTSPVISYTRFGLLTIDLKIARPAGSLGLLGGNCGPHHPILGIPTWVCSYLVRGSESQGPGIPGLAVGEYVDLALLNNGLAAAVYTSHSTEENSVISLNVTRQMLPLFLPLLRR